MLPLHALRCFVLWDFCSLHCVSHGCCRIVFRFVIFTGCDLMFSWFGEKLIFSCRVIHSIWIKSSVSGVVDFQLALVMVHRLCDGFELIGAADELCYLQWKSMQISAFDWGCAAIILCWLRCGTAVGTPDHTHLCSIPTWHTHYHTHLHSGPILAHRHTLHSNGVIFWCLFWQIWSETFEMLNFGIIFKKIHRNTVWYEKHIFN